MPIRGNIIVVFFLLFFYACTKKEEAYKPDPYIQLVKKWTTTEIISQKLLSEKKINDSLNCVHIKDSLNIHQKDSVLLYWSNHPSELRKILEHLLNQSH